MPASPPGFALHASLIENEPPPGAASVLSRTVVGVPPAPLVKPSKPVSNDALLRMLAGANGPLALPEPVVLDVTDTVADVADVSPVALNRSVDDPLPVIDRPENVATPLELVVAAVVPPKVPMPVAIAAVTATPLWAIALFDASRS